MEFLIPLIPFVVAGLIVMFIAFSGGPSAAREAYLTRGRRVFTISMLVLYLGLGIAIPAVVIASRGESVGGTGSLRSEEVSGKLEDGKQLFIQTCKSCHTLAAVDAHGVTGPNLDELGGLDKQRVLRAIKVGGTGSGRMPPELLTGADADAVATYVSAVAGRAPPAARAAAHATFVAFCPQAPGFSVRAICSGASMAASVQAEAPRGKRGVGEPDGRSAGGESPQGVAHLFQREPVS
jgi:cytochrome c553